MEKINHIDYNAVIKFNCGGTIIPSHETLMYIKQQEIIKKINEIIDFINEKVNKREINEPVIQDIIINRNSTANSNWNK